MCVGVGVGVNGQDWGGRGSKGMEGSREQKGKVGESQGQRGGVGKERGREGRGEDSTREWPYIHSLLLTKFLNPLKIHTLKSSVQYSAIWRRGLGEVIRL